MKAQNEPETIPGRTVRLRTPMSQERAALRSALKQQISVARVFSTGWRYRRFGTRSAVRKKVGGCID